MLRNEQVGGSSPPGSSLPRGVLPPVPPNGLGRRSHCLTAVRFADGATPQCIRKTASRSAGAPAVPGLGLFWGWAFCRAGGRASMGGCALLPPTTLVGAPAEPGLWLFWGRAFCCACGGLLGALPPCPPVRIWVGICLIALGSPCSLGRCIGGAGAWAVWGWAFCCAYGRWWWRCPMPSIQAARKDLDAIDIVIFGRHASRALSFAARPGSPAMYAPSWPAMRPTAWSRWRNATTRDGRGQIASRAHAADQGAAAIRRHRSARDQSLAGGCTIDPIQ